MADDYRALQFVGTPATVRERLEVLVVETKADEVMITTTVHSREERLRSFELMAEVMGLSVPVS